MESITEMTTTEMLMVTETETRTLPIKMDRKMEIITLETPMVMPMVITTRQI